MSGIGRLNLLGIFAMPVFAALASIIVFGEENYAQVQVFVFGTNLIPMLIGGVVSAFLIRSANKKSKNKWVAISPTLLPAGLGILWYLIGIINTSAYDAGREFFAGPIYLLLFAASVSVIAIIANLVMPATDS